MSDLGGLEVGYDIPARPGMDAEAVATPCLIVDLDALERNLRKLAHFVEESGLRLRAHGKMHKSVDLARLQMEIGGASGICAQKVSEAEAFVRGGIPEVLVSNVVRDRAKIERLVRLIQRGARVSVCVDREEAVVELAQAARRFGTEIGCLVEADIGARRCGVTRAEDAVAIAATIEMEEGLRYEGLQAYQGSLQHIEDFAARQAAAAKAHARVRALVAALTDAGLPPETVTGGGTGSFALDADSGVYTELQCGSYALMDADYGRVRDAAGRRLDAGTWENALFVWTQVVSRNGAGAAICDAGLKASSVDSGLPRVWGPSDLDYVAASDEHGTIRDPRGRLSIGDKLRLVPGHCDPTVNLHDWLVCLRGGRVEALWPVSARGKGY